MTSLILATSLLLAAPDSTTLLDSLVTANARTVEWTDGRLGGPGLAYLLAEAADAQFVCLGEEHNAREIPQLTTALFTELQKTRGFEFLALEQDPVAARLASRPPLKGSRDSLFATARKYPHRYTFMTDQELAMIADVAARSRTKSEAIWGCDQAFGVTHVLDRLALITRDPAVRAWADTARAHEAVRDLAKGHYMIEPLPWLADLRTRITPGGEADFLLSSLEASNRIYRHYVEGRYYQNGTDRELYMKRRFLEQYRLAERADGREPRVLLKFGHWHLFRGLGPSSLQTLGNFATEFALGNGHTALTVALFPLGEPGAYGDLAKWNDLVPSLLARPLPRDRWTLVDLRPLRARLGEVMKDVPAPQRASFVRWIHGFDFALYLGGAQRGSYEENPGVPY